MWSETSRQNKRIYSRMIKQCKTQESYPPNASKTDIPPSDPILSITFLFGLSLLTPFPGRSTSRISVVFTAQKIPVPITTPIPKKSIRPWNTSIHGKQPQHRQNRKVKQSVEYLYCWTKMGMWVLRNIKWYLKEQKDKLYAIRQPPPQEKLWKSWTSLLEKWKENNITGKSRPSPSPYG